MDGDRSRNTGATHPFVALGLVALALGQCRCSSPDAAFEAFEPQGQCELYVEAMVSEQIPTVVTVRFSFDQPGVQSTNVRFGSTGQCEQSVTPHLLADGSYEAYLVGSKSSSEVFFQVDAETADAVCTTEIESVFTGELPGDLPNLAAEVVDPASFPGGFMLTSLVSNPYVPAIVDRDGDYVWFHRELAETRVVPRVRLSVDGRSVVYLRENQLYTSGEDEQPHNDIVRVRLDGTEVETIPVGYAHHDFEELPDGTIALISGDVRLFDGALVEGARIVEVAPDGTSEVAWSVWDHTSPEGLDGEADWVHANALRYVPAEDAYYVGLGWLAEIWKIDRSTSEVVWRLGMSGETTFVEADDETVWFAVQHGFDPTENGIVVHDNQGIESYSRVVEYELDEGEKTARQVWQYAPSENFLIYALGDVSRLDGGLSFITWSSAGQADIVTQHDEQVWQINTELGAGFGYASWLNTLDARRDGGSYPAEGR